MPTSRNKQTKNQITNITLHLKKLGKEQKLPNGYMKGYNNQSWNKKVEFQKHYKSSITLKAGFEKIDKTLAGYIKGKREKVQINKIINGREVQET